MNEIRKMKIESLIQELIGNLILMEEIKDPRVSTFLSVSSVKVSNDLSLAKIHITSFQSSNSVAKGVEALNHAAGFIHEKLKKKMNVRTVPKLTFFIDDSIQQGMELNKKIDTLTPPPPGN